MTSLNLDIGVWMLLVIILVGLMAVFTGIISYFLKDIRTSIKEKFGSVDGRMNDFEKRFTELLTALPRTYLHRDDWMRDQNINEKRLQEMNTTINQINQNLLKLIQPGGREHV